jgi:hypothetical protein
MSARNLLHAIDVGVENADQLGFRQVSVDPYMMLAQMADPNNATL